VNRYHVPHAPVHQRLSDPSVFIDVCHLTPEGIDRLAEAFLPEVADLVEQTEAHEKWKASQKGGVEQSSPP
jgi:hypothetical protein